VTAISALGSKSKAGGPENFQFMSTAKIGSGGSVATGITGSKANDIAVVSYSGENDGDFGVFEQGNGGNDQLSADVYMVPGSTGRVGSPLSPSDVRTSGKKDRLRFTIHQGTDSTTTTNIYADLIDTSKKDSALFTQNVTVDSKGTNVIEL
jgi:hypothetical protein